MRTNQKPKKTSLVNIFVILVATFLFSFLFIVFLSYTKHIEYKNILTTINTLSIPKIINSSQVFHHANSLVYLTEKLNNSKTKASRRLVYNEIVKEIKKIKRLGNKLSEGNTFLNTNLDSIKSELYELNILIENRLNIQKKIETKVEMLNNLQSQVLSFYEKNDVNIFKNKMEVNKWRLYFTEITKLSYQSLNIRKLNQLKENISQQKRLFTLLENTSKNVTIKPFYSLKEFGNQLQKDTFDKDGLLNLRLKQLKINGRATGHGNFVNNLINDFTIELEYTAINYSQSIIIQSKKNQDKANKQIKLLVVYFVLIFLILLSIIYYINNLIIKRLILLNQNVQQKINGEHIKLKDERNDEISHITYSINYFAKKVYEQNKQLEELSLNDSLTGISNRRAFDIKLEAELNLVQRNDYVMSLLMIDVDYFKLYNDTYGHLEGDDCLKKIASAIKSVVKRDLDLVSRYGGEEFACILSNCNTKNATQVANEILNQIKTLKIHHPTSRCSNYISVSIGFTTVSNNDSLDYKTILINADKSLYKAKQNGRNQVVSFLEL